MAHEITVDAATFEGIVKQLAPVITTNRWSLTRPPANTMRGVDFYNATDFLAALVRSVLLFNHAHGYMPQLAAPTRFNEHILARKFFAPLPMPSLADKLGVRDYVRQRLGEDALVPVVWSGEHIDDLFTADLPAGRFVLKANHGCAMNLFLDLPQDLTARREEIVSNAQGWLATRFGYELGEWQYCVFKPKLFLETFLSRDGIDPMVEVKIQCFHGIPRLIQIVADRFTHLRLGTYTPDWRFLGAGMVGYDPTEFERPKNLDGLIETAARLAQGLEYARVDLYTDFDRIIRFGEITFTPGDGRQLYSDPEFERWLGGFFTPGAGA